MVQFGCGVHSRWCQLSSRWGESYSIKRQKRLKFSHWLGVKVPASLDGLQGLTHTNSLTASYIICSICSPLNSQSCCKPLHLLLHWIFSLENFNSVSWLNSKSPPLPTGRVRMSFFIFISLFFYNTTHIFVASIRRKTLCLMWGDTEMAKTQPQFSEWAHGMGEKIKATNSYNRKRPLPWACQPWKGESLFNSVL